MIKLTKKLLNENRIYNSHDIAKLTDTNPFIYFFPADHGRITSPAKYQIIRIGYNTDPKASWDDHGNKTFNAWRKEDKEPILAEAKAWVKERYGLDITEKEPLMWRLAVGWCEIRYFVDKYSPWDHRWR